MKEHSQIKLSRKRLRSEQVQAPSKLDFAALHTPVRGRPVTRHNKENAYSESWKKKTRSEIYRMNPGAYTRPLENGSLHSTKDMRLYQETVGHLAAMGNDLQLAETLQAVELAMGAGGTASRSARALHRARAALRDTAGEDPRRKNASTSSDAQYSFPLTSDLNEGLNQVKRALRALLQDVDVQIVLRTDEQYDQLVTHPPSLEDIFILCGANAVTKGRKKRKLTNQAVITETQAERLILSGDVLEDECVLVAVHDGHVIGFIYTIDQSRSSPESTDIMNYELRVNEDLSSKPKPLGDRRMTRRKSGATPQPSNAAEPPPYVSRATQHSSLEIVAICSRGGPVRGIGRLLIIFSMVYHYNDSLAGVILDVVHEEPRNATAPSDDPHRFQGQWEKESKFNARIATYYAEQFRFGRCFDIELLGDQHSQSAFVEGHAPYTSKPLKMVSALNGPHRGKLAEKCIMYRPYPTEGDLAAFVGRLGSDISS